MIKPSPKAASKNNGDDEKRSSLELVRVRVTRDRYQMSAPQCLNWSKGSLGERGQVMFRGVQTKTFRRLSAFFG